jgi:hypothetical protein
MLLMGMAVLSALTPCTGCDCSPNLATNLAQQPLAGGATAPSGPGEVRVGFNVGGMDWTHAELVGVTDPAEIRQRREEIGRQEAGMVRAMGGNRIRMFYADYGFMGMENRLAFSVGDPRVVGEYRRCSCTQSRSGSRTSTRSTRC